MLMVWILKKLQSLAETPRYKMQPCKHIVVAQARIDQPHSTCVVLRCKIRNIGQIITLKVDNNIITQNYKKGNCTRKAHKTCLKMASSNIIIMLAREMFHAAPENTFHTRIMVGKALQSLVAITI